VAATCARAGASDRAAKQRAVVARAVDDGEKGGGKQGQRGERTREVRRMRAGLGASVGERRRRTEGLRPGPRRALLPFACHPSPTPKYLARSLPALSPLYTSPTNARFQCHCSRAPLRVFWIAATDSCASRGPHPPPTLAFPPMSCVCFGGASFMLIACRHLTSRTACSTAACPPPAASPSPVRGTPPCQPSGRARGRPPRAHECAVV
jgi:hypothetical protein